MKNFERYEKELIELVKDVGFSGSIAVSKETRKPCNCKKIVCGNCLLSRSEQVCSTLLIEWLYKEEGKDIIALTKLEYELLKYHLNNGYTYLTRDETFNRISFFKEKPVKSFKSWFSNNKTEINYPVFGEVLTNLFQFVKWEDKEPYKIQDVLDNCMVVEDE